MFICTQKNKLWGAFQGIHHHHHHRVLYRLLLVINISYGYLQLMLLLHQNVFVLFFYQSSMDVTVQIVECFSVFSLCFSLYILFCFLSLGCWIYSRGRVILFVSLCNNIHFSLTFYFTSLRVLFVYFVCVFVFLSELVTFVYVAVKIRTITIWMHRIYAVKISNTTYRIILIDFTAVRFVRLAI